MRCRHLLGLVAVPALITVHRSDAQTTIKTTSLSPTMTALLAPLATTSFAPMSLSSSLNGSTLVLALTGVSITAPGTGPVMLEKHHLSVVTLNAPQGIANGTYSVVFTFTWVNAPATLVFLNGSTVVAQCVLQQQLSYAAGAPVQRCDSGPLSIGDQKLNLNLQIAQAIESLQLNLSQVTVNQLRTFR